ncbi:PAS domain S-box protein, partial [candidate division WOR-3 bacterium]|nr:PAS domain S-box protein [candidate division WOR-3 bacterium]
EGFINDITARKRAEEALVASREEFSSLLERAPVGIYRTTPDGRILIANPALVRLLGYRSFDELAARRLGECRFQPGYDREDFIRRLEAEGEIAGLETTWTRADGSPVYVRENARLVRSASGQPEYYEGTVEDLTDRRRAEEEVWRAKERLRTLQENVPVGLFRTTPDGRLLAANPAAVRIFGYDSEEEFRAAGAGAVYADPAERQRIVERLVVDGRLDDVEVRGRRKDGTEFPALLNVTAIRDAAGAVEYFDGVTQDISDRKAAEAARRESEERYRRLVELSPDGIAVHQDGVIKMVNPAGARTLGYDSPAEMVGLPVLGLVHPDDRVRVVARITGVRERGEPGELAEERFRRKDGSWVWVEVVNAPFTWEGRPAVQVVVRDISERREAEAARREAERRYRQVVERATDGICIIQDGQVVFVNERLARMALGTPEELTGTPFEQHLHPDSRPVVAERYRLRMAGEPVPEVYEAALLAASGARIDAELSAGVIDYHGRPADLVFVRDISERKQRQAELVESEERYRQLFELAPNGIAVHQDGIVKLVNPAVLAILGYESAGELAGRPVLDFVYPDDRAAVAARIRQAAEQGRMAPVAEERFVRKDGTPVWVEAVGTPFTWEGRPAVRVFVRDISARVAARQQADETAELLRTLIDSSPHGFAAIQDKRVVMVNRAWAKLLGYDDPVELVGENYLDRVPDDDRARAAEGAGSAAFDDGRPIIETLRLRRRDGGWAEIRAMVSVMPWRGRPALFLTERPAGR